MTHPAPRPTPGPPPGQPETITVELVGGPLDGTIQAYTRGPGQVMPHELVDHAGYRLIGLDNRPVPARWLYAWQHPFTGHRQPCGQAGCKGAGCPNGKHRRPG